MVAILPTPNRCSIMQFSNIISNSSRIPQTSHDEKVPFHCLFSLRNKRGLLCILNKGRLDGKTATLTKEVIFVGVKKDEERKISYKWGRSES